jgi:adenylate kinase
MLDALEPVVQDGGCILDFHSAEVFPERWIDLVLVMRTDNTILYDRLEKRYLCS